MLHVARFPSRLVRLIGKKLYSRRVVRQRRGHVHDQQSIQPPTSLDESAETVKERFRHVHEDNDEKQRGPGQAARDTEPPVDRGGSQTAGRGTRWGGGGTLRKLGQLLAPEITRGPGSRPSGRLPGE